MATMISEIYTAFKKAGVPEKDAVSAAEALAAENLATKADIQKLDIKITGELEKLDSKVTGEIQKLDEKIIKIDKELLLVKWMIGLVIAIQIIPYIRALTTHIP